MKGWLIVNGFLKSSKFDELTGLFAAAADKNGIELTVIKNYDILADTGRVLSDKPDFAIFWDKDIGLGTFLEMQGIPLYNSISSIRICDDKRLTHLALLANALPMPRTILAPKTYDNIGFTELCFLSKVERELSFPLVIKEAFGSFGEQVYRIENREQLLSHMEKTATTNLLFQQYIETSRGRDLRLQVVGDRVVAAMYRHSETDFRANLTAGGRMECYEPTGEECDLAIRAAHAVGAAFAGVDLLFGPDGPLICEVNSNAHFKNLLDCTGINAAEEMIDYIRRDQRGSE